MNDGIGNPKNAKNLLLAHQTPPTTSLGVRENAKVSVRAGIKNILFTIQPEEVAEALDEYLQSLKPIASPHLVNGQLSESAAGGKRVFNDEVVGCADCHKPGLFTNLKAYDVGTRGKFDNPANKYDTPSLIEVWRSAPYLHDGSAAYLVVSGQYSCLVRLIQPRANGDFHTTQSCLKQVCRPAPASERKTHTMPHWSPEHGLWSRTDSLN